MEMEKRSSFFESFNYSFKMLGQNIVTTLLLAFGITVQASQTSATPELPAGGTPSSSKIKVRQQVSNVVYKGSSASK